MENTYEKQDGQLKVTSTRTTVNSTLFTREYLNTQRQAIIDRKAADDATRDNEIADVDAMLAQCDELEVE